MMLIHEIHVLELQIEMNVYNNQLPVGLVAQLVEHCTGIAEARVRIPVQAFLVTA